MTISEFVEVMLNGFAIFGLILIIFILLSLSDTIINKKP